jgi:hypothetical protein
VNEYGLSRAAWRTSSHSGQNGDCVEVAAISDAHEWRASSRSGQNGNCVEVASRCSWSCRCTRLQGP